MSVKTQHNSECSFWFITFTCYDWKHLFELSKSYDLVYNWFSYLRQQKLADVISYVIMPNHLHAVLNLPDENKSVNTIIGNGKRFMAYEIIKRLKDKGEIGILAELASAVSLRDTKKGQQHKVFKDSFDGKAIFTEKFLFQKIDYIHHNPVSGKWKLVNDYVDYEHSSASFYELGLAKHFEPKHFRDA
jgi:REP element-mobilizing transposase RayT